MIETPLSQRRYESARKRFLKPAIISFFAREFPRFFGPMIREKLADELIGLLDGLSPDSQRLEPGQIIWNALDKRTRAGSANERLIPVVLSIITDEDIKLLSAGVAMSKITKRAIARVMREAYAQGALLSVRDIGLLILRDPSSVSSMRIAYEKEHNCLLPHSGIFHDMGSCISHKTSIVRKVTIDKKDPADVARETNHSQKSVDRYLNDYNKVKAICKLNKDVDYIHVATGMAKHVIKQYLKILEQESNECAKKDQKGFFVLEQNYRKGEQNATHVSVSRNL